jgi:hypothetical protein
MDFAYDRDDLVHCYHHYLRLMAWIEQSLAPLLAGPATAIAGPWHT